MPAAPSLLEGQRCTAEQAADGTWTIHGVPLFGEMTWQDQPVDKAWLERSVQIAQDGYRRAEYLGPLNKNHHDYGDVVSPAGKFLPTHVARAQTRDGEVWAAFGDMVGVFPEVFEEIRSNRLSYVSCENNMKRGTLEVCSLLPTRAPVHKFRPLTIGRAVPAKKTANLQPDLVAFSESGVGARFLSRIPAHMSISAAPAAPSKTATAKFADDPTKKKPDDAAPPADAPPAAPAAPETPPDAGAMPPADPAAAPPAAPGAPPAPVAPPGAPGAPPAPAGPPAAAPIDVGAAIMTLGAKVDQMLTILMKALEDEPDNVPGEPVAPSGSPSTAFAERTAELSGEVKGLKATITEMKTETARDKALAAFETELAPFAVAGVREELEGMYAAGGSPACRRYVDGLKRYAPKDPTASTLDGESGEPVVIHDELHSFANRGPDELAEVSRLSREYDGRGKAFQRSMSRVDFVDLHLNRMPKVRNR